MKITMFSINPIFPDRINGGSPKHLQNVAVYLGQLGHDVTILSTRHPDNDGPFQWHERVTVRPLLNFKQPFPEPYAIPAYELALIFQDVAEYLQTADRFYVHDGELLFPPLYHHIPTVVALRDNVYPETILGSFLFQGDVLIANSDYSRRLYLATAGRFLADLPERLIVISNGIDAARFKPTPPSPELRHLLPVDPTTETLLLHPHRPEPSKGLAQTVQVVDRLVNQYGLGHIKTLVPKWFEVSLSPEVAAYYRDIEQAIKYRSLSDNFLFHDWIPQRLMPEYYSLGRLTLALGHYVEAMGNVPYESLACGTPAIVARVSSHRDVLPDDLIDKVHFGDVEQAAAAAAKIITADQTTRPETLAYLQTHYSVERQLSAFAEAILNAKKLPPMRYRFEKITPATRFTLSPWCYRWADTRFYHDFLAEHRSLPALADLLDNFPHVFSVIEAETLGVAADTVMAWYRQGYLVPIKNAAD